ncbi:MAG TPA: hypothetical protein VGT03_10480 [Candidatus Acidoferrales bacterium]|nr:hypothetical protein [Candidatus Acidoferrales bacterium]
MHKSSITAWLAAGLLLLLVGAPATAQDAGQVASHASAIPVYDSAHETLVQGNIESVVTRTNWGGSFGMHLVVTTLNGSVDAHLGPFATMGSNALNFHKGDAVQIVGVMATIDGKQVLLARTLMIGGRTLVIRNQHGFLVHPGAPRASTSKTSGEGGL